MTFFYSLLRKSIVTLDTLGGTYRNLCIGESKPNASDFCTQFGLSSFSFSYPARLMSTQTGVTKIVKVNGVLIIIVHIVGYT